VIIRLKNNTAVKGKNAAIDFKAGTLVYDSHGEKNLTITLADIDSLSYSDTDRRRFGAFAGAGFGLATAFLVQKDTKTRSGETFYSDFLLPGKDFLRTVVLVPVCSYLGYLIGSHIYTDWRSIDLSNYKHDNIQTGVFFDYGSIGVRLSVPLELH